MIAGYYEREAGSQTAKEGESTVVSLAGSFNDWDLSATPLDNTRGNFWRAVMSVDKAGPIEFKFAANQSREMSSGERDQSTKGFPVSGDLEIGVEADNLRAYLLSPGRYILELDLNGRHTW